MILRVFITLSDYVCNVTLTCVSSGESSAVAGTVGNLSKSAEVMKLVNDLMKAPQMAAIMQEFGKEMTKVPSYGFLSLII